METKRMFYKGGIYIWVSVIAMALSVSLSMRNMLAIYDG